VLAPGRVRGMETPIPDAVPEPGDYDLPWKGAI
jgi:hypothetical protein